MLAIIVSLCAIQISSTRFQSREMLNKKHFFFVYEGLHGSRVLGPGNMDVSTDTTAPQ